MVAWIDFVFVVLNVAVACVGMGWAYADGQQTLFLCNLFKSLANDFNEGVFFFNVVVGGSNDNGGVGIYFFDFLLILI